MIPVDVFVELLLALQGAAVDAAVSTVDVGTVPLDHGGIDEWGKGNLFKGFTGALKRVASISAITMIIAVPLYVALYWWSKRHTVPVVVLVLMGGTVLPLLPATVARMLWIVILVSGGFAIFAALWLVIR